MVVTLPFAVERHGTLVRGSSELVYVTAPLKSCSETVPYYFVWHVASLSKHVFYLTPLYLSPFTVVVGGTTGTVCVARPAVAAFFLPFLHGVWKNGDSTVGGPSTKKL